MPKNKVIYHKDHDDENSVYMYYNDKWNIKLFVSASPSGDLRHFNRI